MYELFVDDVVLIVDLVLLFYGDDDCGLVVLVSLDCDVDFMVEVG